MQEPAQSQYLCLLWQLKLKGQHEQSSAWPQGSQSEDQAWLWEVDDTPSPLAPLPP